MNEKHQEMIDAIRQYPAGERIIAHSFNWAWRTRTAGAAFKKAHELGLIRPAYKSADGTQVWERA